jgi:hypothetical protein
VREARCAPTSSEAIAVKPIVPVLVAMTGPYLS